MTGEEREDCGLCFDTGVDTESVPLTDLSEAGGLDVGLTQTQKESLYVRICDSCRERYADTETGQ